MEGVGLLHSQNDPPQLSIHTEVHNTHNGFGSVQRCWVCNLVSQHGCGGKHIARQLLGQGNSNFRFWFALGRHTGTHTGCSGETTNSLQEVTLVVAINQLHGIVLAFILGRDDAICTHFACFTHTWTHTHTHTHTPGLATCSSGLGWQYGLPQRSLLPCVHAQPLRLPSSHRTAPTALLSAPQHAAPALLGSHATAAHPRPPH
eukprot:1152526-Pelagomonas_calceolata.AAC.7